MFDADGAMAILDPLCDKFSVRLKALNELKDKANKALAVKTLSSDEKIAKKLNKRLDKMNKYITKSEKKLFEKQVELLNSNHLDKLEKDLVNSAKLLSQDDKVFLSVLGEMLEEAVQDEQTDKLNFCIKYLELLMSSTENALNIYKKQLNFIQEVFKNVGVNKE